MNKTISFLLILLMISACTQLQHGQEQPVVSKFGKDKEQVYFTTCAGAVEGWPDCYSKASRTCKDGYIVISREDNNRGSKRDLTFQCKK